MPHFLTQVAYNEQAWQSLVSNPQNRLDAIRPVVEKLGGRVVNAYFAFGDYDFVLITELPDNATAAAARRLRRAGCRQPSHFLEAFEERRTRETVQET